MKKFYHILLLAILMLPLYTTSCSKDDDKDGTTTPEIQLLSVSPADGATNVDSETPVYAEFNSAITVKFSQGSVYVNGEKVSFSKDNTKLKISGLNIKANETYQIVISSGTIEGYNKEIAWSFSSTTTTDNPTSNDNPTTNDKVERPHEISATCINHSNATTQQVYEYLLNNYGKKIISGAMANVSVDQNEFALVKNAVDKSPVFQTIDYIHLQYSWGKAAYTNIDKFVEHWNNGGLVGASWHMMVPATQSGVSDEATWKYDNDFDAKAALTDGTWQKAFWDKMLSDCADRLSLFKQAGIVVFWRPLHEAAGHNGNYGQYGWFWWGKHGADTYRKLWKYMFDYFKERGLDNLIWVWNSQYSQETPLDEDWYPGDEYVDIIATDIYKRSTNVCVEIYNLLSENWPNKMVTLGENGGIPNISEVFAAGGKFAYFMPWYTYEITSLNESEHANTTWWQDAANSDVVIFLEDKESW